MDYTDTPKRDMNQKAKQRSNDMTSVNPAHSLLKTKIGNFSKIGKLSLTEEFEHLKRREKELDLELEMLLKEPNINTQLKSNMEQLHLYNDVKDATQVVLGSLARLENITVTELHAQFGLSYVDNDADNSNE